ncbi:hypothetical protein [Hymenobacter sp. BRD67]|uniref:hypothetical protein n=1 Tax=Hymenobacter sp. BRD67 TaxID=2675877 RepID=UPI00156774C3|nr:hypothetical protein [Hymenobacter sp. BRD67]QKG54994.1 hypothetical protein GKZ67_21455 [Hymenobacter sp. BRD67]
MRGLDQHHAAHLRRVLCHEGTEQDAAQRMPHEQVRGGYPARCSSSCRSRAMAAPVVGRVPRSLRWMPARS